MPKNISQTAMRTGVTMKASISLARGVTGAMSPYPTVVIVIIVNTPHR